MMFGALPTLEGVLQRTETMGSWDNVKLEWHFEMCFTLRRPDASACRAGVEILVRTKLCIKERHSMLLDQTSDMSSTNLKFKACSTAHSSTDHLKKGLLCLLITLSTFDLPAGHVPYGLYGVSWQFNSHSREPCSLHGTWCTVDKFNIATGITLGFCG